MSRRGSASWICCFLLLFLPLNSRSEGSNPSIWKGTSGGYGIDWSNSNLRAMRSDTRQIVFDARSDAEAAWSGIVQRSRGGPLQAEFTYRLLSVAGPYLMIEEGEYCDCGGAHPSESRKFRAIELDRSKPGSVEAASLTELFPSQDILKALVSDAVVHRALGSDVAPGSLNELLKQLGDQNVKVGECEYWFPPDLMGSFALYDVQEGNVLVRLALPAAAESCRGRLTQIGMTLASSDVTRPLLMAAKRQHEGLLMAEADRTMRSKVTSFSFSVKGRVNGQH